MGGLCAFALVEMRRVLDAVARVMITKSDSYKLVIGNACVKGIFAAMLASVCAIVAAPPAAHARSANVARVCAKAYGARCTRRLPTGVTMSFVDMGNRHGRPVMFLHGYTDSALAWARIARDLAVRAPALRLILVDQRGAGGGATDAPDTPLCRRNPARCITVADRAGDVIALVRAMHLGRVMIVGHSMGSVVARDVALARPDLVDRLVLISTPDARPPGLAGPAGFTGLDALVPGATGTLGMAYWRARAAAKGLDWPQDVFDLRLIDLDPDAVDHLIADWGISPITDPVIVHDVMSRAALVKLKYWGIDPRRAMLGVEDLTRLRVPALVLWGIQDGLMVRSMQDRLKSDLAKAAHHGPKFSKDLTFFWKQYGIRPNPGPAPIDDLNHELVSDAPAALAQELAAYLLTGHPLDHTFAYDRARRQVVAAPCSPAVCQRLP